MIVMPKMNCFLSNVKKETFTIRWDTETKEKLQEIANQRNCSLNYIVNEIITRFVEKLEEKDGNGA